MAITPFGLALRDLHQGHQLHPFIIEREHGWSTEQIGRDGDDYLVKLTPASGSP